MSKRFGRNQKRRMRERIANLEQAYELETGLLHYQSCRVHELQDELDDAKRMVAEYSGLFKPETIYVGGKPAPVYIAYLRNRFAEVYDPQQQVTPAPFLRHIHLPTLLTEFGVNRFDNMLHVRVEYDGGKWGYAVSRTTMLQTPRDRLIKQIAMHLATQIVTELQN